MVAALPALLSTCTACFDEKLGQLNRPAFGNKIAAARLLGYQDSNLEWRYQKPLCCQLHHTPMALFEIHISSDVDRVSGRDRDYQTTPVFLQIAW